MWVEETSLFSGGVSEAGGKFSFVWGVPFRFANCAKRGTHSFGDINEVKIWCSGGPYTWCTVRFTTTLPLIS